MGNPIFISYRRDDTEGEAGRLFDDLTREFGSNSVFMDVAGIRPGVDFVQAIEQNVADCGVLLAIIGPAWATITSASGQRRLDDPNDFVALEIASALKREVPVIPVLVHGAKMPSQDQLPESLKSFSHRNSVELSHARWPSDVQLLIGALNSYVAPSKATVQEPVHATVPVQLPAPHQPATTAQPVAKKSSLPLIAGIGALVVIVAAVAIYLVMNHAPAAALDRRYTGNARGRRYMEGHRRRSPGGYSQLPGDFRFWKQPYHARLWDLSAGSLRLGYAAGSGRRTIRDGHLPSQRSSRFNRYRSSRVGERNPQWRQSRRADP